MSKIKLFNFLHFVILLLVVFRFEIINASLSSRSFKEKSTPALRDNDVEDIQRDSIHRHIIFALQRFTSLYIAPPFQYIWTATVSPMFHIMLKCYTYLRHAVWQNIYDAVYILYIDTFHPLCNEIWNIISYITHYISSFVKTATHHCIYFTHHYVYPYFSDVAEMICSNICYVIHILKEAMIPMIQWLCGKCHHFTNFLYNYCFEPLYENISIMCLQIKQCVVYMLRLLIETTVKTLAIITHSILIPINYIRLFLYDGTFIVDWLSVYLKIMLNYMIHSVTFICEYVYYYMCRAFHPLKCLMVIICSDYIYPMLILFVDLIEYMWLCVVCVYDMIHRYLLEISVTKLCILSDNEYSNNYEIGVFYATLSVDNKSILYLNENVDANDFVYLWIRNNNELKRANAKVLISNSTKQHYENIVRLNKKQNHVIGLDRSLFQNGKAEKCQLIRMEFMLEDISKTIEHQTNQQSIVNQNNNDDLGNVNVRGVGAKYIAVDMKTKFEHKFSVCYY